MRQRLRVGFAIGVIAGGATTASGVGCGDSRETDVLVQSLVASCERRARCDCTNVDHDEDCEVLARQRASELRARARSVGATHLDESCAESRRDIDERLCRGAGIPFETDVLSELAFVDDCERFLFHGDRRLGEPCDHPVDLFRGWSDCEPGSVCVDFGDGATCTAPVTQHVGSVCRDHDVVFGCPIDAACIDVDANTARCMPLTEVGGPCAGIFGVCVGPPGQWCDVATSTCRAAPDVGDACAGDDQTCGTDAFCWDGVCTRRTAEGDACTVYGECVQGLHCDDGVCKGDEACWL